MRLKLNRQEEDKDGSFGVLLVSIDTAETPYEQANFDVFGVTLEPPDKDNQVNISNIPPGDYIVQWVNSPKYKWTLQIMDVPDRTHVLFHAGNFVADTKACVLVAEKYGKLKRKTATERAILNSGNTFKAFKDLLHGHDNIPLRINDPI